MPMSWACAGVGPEGAVRCPVLAESIPKPNARNLLFQCFVIDFVRGCSPWEAALCARADFRAARGVGAARATHEGDSVGHNWGA
eukprot:3722185-Rhodomonas_salina.1